MYCIPVTGPNIPAQVSLAAQKADILEFRFDLFDTYNIEEIRHLRERLTIPVIFTLRKSSQGGKYQGTEIERLAEIKKLAHLKPDYFDLEYDIPGAWLQEFSLNFPHVKIIISYHDFAKTPENLPALLQELKRHPATIYKIAGYANSTIDSLRMLDFVRTHNILGLCMGDKGEITRILGPMMGAPWTFVTLSDEQKTADGQLSYDELRYIYDIKRLSQKSLVYSLIGGDISKSLGHFAHNHTMRELGIDGIYVRMSLEAEELKEFFHWAKKIDIQGLSVTMPLKEHVMAHLDHIDPKAKAIGAVNSIRRENEKWAGFNADGLGALDAIEEKIALRDKKIVIIGAGGAARSIIYEAMQRGAHVTILNRTKEKAQALAEEFGAHGAALEDISHHANYDVLINTTPDHLPIPAEAIRSGSIVMDIKSIPQMTEFLKHAKEKGCVLIFGYEMYVNQAVFQYDFWFFSKLDPKMVKRIFKAEVLKHLS